VTDINEFILNKLDKMDEKLDDVKDAQADAKVQLAKQSAQLDDYNKSLEEHMRRTDLLEGMVKPMHKEWTDKQAVEQAKMKTWKKVAAIVGLAATLVGLLAGIAQLAGLL
jgi:chromosome segregation ATPase